MANPIGRTIVTTAGNTGALAKVEDKKSPRNGGLHSRKPITASGTATMQFVVPDRDEEDDWLNIWYGGATRLSLQLREPDGALTAPVGPDDPTYTTPLAGHGMYISNTTVESVTGRHNIAIRISPRANPSPNVAGTVKPGPWTLTLTETAGTGDDVDCWINRGGKDRCPRFVNADQDRTRTLGSPGTAHNVITVANYNHSTNKIDESSSRGPTIDNRPAGETKPDLAAPGVGIVAAKSSARNTGVCCDCCYDFYVTLSGTSMSAPHVTGVVALLFQAEPTLTWDGVRTRLRDGADPPDPITGPTLPDAVWGEGILNAKKTLLIADGTGPVARAGRDVVGLPLIAPGTWAADGTSVPARLTELRARVLRTPLGQLTAVLVGAHYDEGLRLVNTRRRVTVAWHRMHGPALLRHVIGAPPGTATLIPATFEGLDVRQGLDRFLTELAREGSLPLRADIARHREFLLALPGLDVTALEDAREPADLVG